MFLYRREEDFSDLGRAVMQRAREIVHAKHLEGEFAPSLQDALLEASRIVCAGLVKTVKKIQEGKNGNGKNRK
jgi:hypothetical protein